MKPPKCMATLIGSLPLEDPEAAVQLVFEHLSEAPIWPELPRHSFLEGMVASHTEGLPGLVVDKGARRFYVDTARDCAGELAAYYEKAILAEQSGDLSAFALTSRYASALEATERRLKGSGKIFPVFKVQCIGPVSFQLQLVDEEGRPLYYHETFQDVLIRQITLQARWLADHFRRFGETLMVFLDEPALAAFGSSGYIGVARQDVIGRLGAVVAALKAQGAVVGVHVCGNTDWPMIMEAGADVLNYDAYAFGQSMALYPRELGAHLSRGGVLAFGMVPTSEEIRQETVETLEERFFSLVADLASRGLDREQLLNQSMITPSCGMGAISTEDTLRVFKLLTGLARSVQAKTR